MSLQSFLEQLNSGNLPPPRNELERALSAGFVKQMEGFRALEETALEDDLINTLDHLADLLNRYTQALDKKHHTLDENANNH